MKKVLGILLAIIMCFSIVGCQPNEVEPGGDDLDLTQMTPITIVTGGWINTPFPKEGDPFREYLKEKYKLDITVLAYSANDFTQQLQVALAGKNKPDLINFASVTDFNKYYDDGSLIDDFSGYLENVPNLKDTMLNNQFAMSQLATTDNKPKALWGNQEEPSWSLKVRKDWVKEYASAKGKPNGFVLATPTDVLDFARWIKTAKNKDQNNLDTFAFNSCGSGNSIGTTLEWTQNMFGFSVNGLLNAPKMGFYIDPATNTIKNPITDGSYAKWLEFLKTIVDEKLIAPGWFTNDWTLKNGLLFGGKTAFDWFPGVITAETFNANRDVPETNNGKDTLEWWGNMEIPSDGSYGSGVIPVGGNIGHIWTVSYNTSLDEVKMIKITKLLNDIAVQYGEDKNAKDFYKRSETYDKLRWGLGVVDGINEYKSFDDTNLVGCFTSPNADEHGSDYRSDNPATWDWGSWFSTRSDGVLQLTSKKPEGIEMAKLAGVLDGESGTFEQLFCPGSALIYDNVKLTKMFEAFVTFTHAYATGKNTESLAQFQQRWKTELEGDKMAAAAETQFKKLGYMK